MAETPQSKKPRQGLSPGAWSALAAVTVALIGGAVTLTTAWWSHRTPPAPASSTQAPAVLPDPTAWAGSYSGLAQEPGGARFKVIVEIAPGCVKDAACGTISVPHVPCTGWLTLVEVRADGAEFSVGHFDKASDPKACQAGAGEVLRARPDGDLAYTATYSGAHGVLARVEPKP